MTLSFLTVPLNQNVHKKQPRQRKCSPHYNIKSETMYYDPKLTAVRIAHSKIPIIRTGKYASSAVHTMYCQNCPMFGTYNRSFRVHMSVSFWAIRRLFPPLCSTAQHSSGYKPIFLDSMELVAIEQASIVYSGARTALERSAHVDHRRHHCRACAACCAAVPTLAAACATPPPLSTSY